MANEAVCIEKPTRFKRYVVADAEAVVFGTLMKLTDPNTCTATSADNDPFAGIAWESKTANDGATEITCATDGIWDLKDSGAGSAVGTIVAVAGANIFSTAAAADFLQGSAIGKLLETAGAAEVCRVSVGNY